MDIPKEYPLYYPLRPATLKQFASTKLALDLWRRKGFDFANSIVTCPEERFSCEEMLQIALPSSIRDVIDQRIRSIRKELKKLFENFNELNIIANLNENALECINCITYGPDGALNLEASVRNMLTTDELSVFEKYMIACVYRCDKDIRKFWPLVFDHLFKNMADSRRFQIMRFSSTGSLGMNPIATAVLNRPELYIYGLMDCGNWTGVEYFLDCLGNTEDQCRVLSHTLEAYSFKNIKYVLPKLNKDQVDYLLSTYPDRIILTLACEEGYFEYVLKIWSLVKESITENHFCSLLTDLIHNSYVSGFGTNCRNYDQVSQTKMVFYEIWTSAADRLKNAFFAHDIFEVFNLFIILPLMRIDRLIKTKDFDLDVKFFSRLLADMPDELRNTIWIEYWTFFIIFFNLEQFEKFMRFCLRNNAIEEFVGSKMLNYETSQTYVEYSLKLHLYENIIEYIDYCSTFCDEGVGRFKRQLRELIPLNTKDLKFKKLIELGALVGKISSVVEAERIKETMFSSNDVQKLLVSKLKEGLANEVISITERFLSTERRIQERQIFRDHWVNFLTLRSNEIDVEIRWNEFSSWWKGSGDDCPMFKLFLPVDDIFEKLFLEAVPKLALWLGPTELRRIEPVPSSAGKLEEFAPVDEFLMWYFGTELEVRNYKWSKILSYQNMTALKNLLSINNECIVNDALRWFFNGDLIELGNFKDSCKRNMRL